MCHVVLLHQQHLTPNKLVSVAARTASKRYANNLFFLRPLTDPNEFSQSSSPDVVLLFYAFPDATIGHPLS